MAEKRSIDTVLLTGATGYVGIHVLHELIVHTDAFVTCLIRAPGAEAGKARILDTFSWYFPGFDSRALENRVAVAAGDVGSECLGLTARTYDQLRETQHFIINCAATLGQAGSPRTFQTINVEGVARLIEFAMESAAELHHLSTIDVVGSYRERPAFDCFTEAHLDEGQVLSSAYAETKHKAEMLMRARFREGLKGAVYRIGYVAPHSISGRFQRNIHENGRVRSMRFIIKLGVAPFDPSKTIRLTPVDTAAKAILALVVAKAPEASTYYIQTPQEVSQQSIIQALHAAGYAIRLLEPNEFAEKLVHLTAESDDILGSSRRPKGDELSTIPPNGDWSVKELGRVGFEYPRVSSAWFGKFLHHCVGTGFLEAPRFWALGAIPDRLW